MIVPSVATTPSPRARPARRAPRRARARARRPGSGRRRAPRSAPRRALRGRAASAGAELRPEQRQVRLDAQLGGLDLAELDLLDAQLVGDLVGVRRRARRAGDDQPAQRLAELQPRARARLAAELDDRAHLGDLGEQRPVGLGDLGPAGEVHRGLAALARGCARGGRRGTASPARRPAATGRARTRACGTPPRSSP